MDSSTSKDTRKMTRTGSRLGIRIILAIFSLILYMASLFLIAGRLDWLQGWVFMAIFLTGQSIHFLYLWRKNPEVLKARARIGRNTKKWDKTWLTFFAILYLAVLYVGALDSGRYEWSRMPDWLLLVGAALYVFFMALVTWAMSVNPHFEKTVRIQHDRNHRVIDTGPYHIVRHPGYIGSIFGFTLSAPLMLGSWWAMIPAGLTTLWLVFRTALEDRTLRRELAGYEEYARRVRYRLIPFVW